jgi:hypothetical protein
MREKITLAKKYGDKVKSITFAYNNELRSLWERHLSLIKKSTSNSAYVDAILDSLVDSLRDLLSRVIAGVITLAMEREDVQDENMGELIPLMVAQCNVAYYNDTLDKYKGILREEIAFAIENGYLDELHIFLESPLAYLSLKQHGLMDFKQSVTDAGKGVSYSFSENMKKLGISAAALAYANAQFSLWNQNSAISGYFGVRNSSYPCSLCDSYAYRFIPMSEGMVYPLHNRCVCSIVPVTQSELSL